MKLDRFPNWAWVPLASMLALLVPAVLAVATHRLLLFASLGPTAIIVVQQPTHPSARTYNVIAGHTVGLIAGAAFVMALGLSHTPSIFLLHEVSTVRAVAAIGAIGVAAALEMLLRAQHPPAASTTLLVALGSFHPEWSDAAQILGGVIAVAVSSEALRRLRMAGRTPAVAAGPD